MVATSHKPILQKESNTPDTFRKSVNLITGLLGSGKTTVLKTLLKHKPADETWALLVNEFGEIGIDAALLESFDTPLQEIKGGCLCCTAQFGYQQALGNLLKLGFDRLFIEPTGLGHPANTIDILQSSSFKEQLKVYGIFCVITPQQLTKERWQKAKVMRDLVTLADVILLNKIDQSSENDISEAQEILQTVYPRKTEILQTDFLHLNDKTLPEKLLSSLDFKQPPQPFVMLEGLEDHQKISNLKTVNLHSLIGSCIELKGQFGSISSLGWVFDAKVQFNRNRLKEFTTQYSKTLLRAKGVIRTGKEWQSLNWIDQTITLEDIAWRQDSRLELIFSDDIQPILQSLEADLKKAIHAPI